MELTATKKIKYLRLYKKKLNADIYSLQDTHFTSKLTKEIYTEWNGECVHSIARSNARGVSILFKKEFTIYYT